MNLKKFMVFDVESVGLHGEGFAVGFVVVDSDGNQLDCGRFACPYNAAIGGPHGFEWVKKNVPPLTHTHDSPWQVRSAFWQKWQEWQDKSAVMVADCAWPVEARFLHQCVTDNLVSREWGGPYPLHDLASILLASGKKGTETFERIAGIETPEHDPLADARQSARILLQHLYPKPNLPD